MLETAVTVSLRSLSSTTLTKAHMTSSSLSTSMFAMKMTYRKQPIITRRTAPGEGYFGSTYKMMMTDNAHNAPSICKGRSFKATSSGGAISPRTCTRYR